MHDQSDHDQSESEATPMRQATSAIIATTGAIAFLATSWPASVTAQDTESASSFVQVAATYRVAADITYLRAGGVDLKLDVYQPRTAEGPNPTLVYFHGGGWTNGSKEGSALTFLPYLEQGWTVVNVAYRLADVAPAPAAVEDCRCALRWIYRNNEQYGIDTSQIVVTGNSAGGHLALTTGMLPGSAGLDRQCPGNRRRTWSTGSTSTDELQVAAIINWYGITDVEDLLYRTPGTSGSFTEAWVGSTTDRDAVAKRVSPLTYVGSDTPPVLTVHGDADPIVPYEHATWLHKALDEEQISNELVTVPGGGHGGFSVAENERIYGAIWSFLRANGVGSDE